MDAVVLSGGIPKQDEPLFQYTQGEPKALVDIGGKPMIQWVLDALEQAETVTNVVIVGLSPENNLTCSKINAYIPSENDLLKNVRIGVIELAKQNPEFYSCINRLFRYTGNYSREHRLGGKKFNQIGQGFILQHHNPPGYGSQVP